MTGIKGESIKKVRESLFRWIKRWKKRQIRKRSCEDQRWKFRISKQGIKRWPKSKSRAKGEKVWTQERGASWKRREKGSWGERIEKASKTDKIQWRLWLMPTWIKWAYENIYQYLLSWIIIKYRMNSYHYLFKFIVIGDTGKHLHRLRRWQILHRPPVYREQDQSHPRCDHRCRIRSQDHTCQRQKHQATNMGHCRSGKLSFNYTVLLSKRYRCSSGLRHHKVIS